MRINIIQITIFALTCWVNAINNPEKYKKAQQVIEKYNQDDEVDPDEVMQILSEFLKEYVEPEEVAEELESVKLGDFRYGLSSTGHSRLNNACQALMSESSKDLPAAYECMTKLLMLSNFANKKQTRLDSKYYLVLLYFNLHHQNEEFMDAYLAMCVKMFIEYYNEASAVPGNNMKIAKSMIRAIYAANRIGEKVFAKMLLNMYREQCKNYNASQFEKNLLKNV